MSTEDTVYEGEKHRSILCAIKQRQDRVCTVEDQNSPVNQIKNRKEEKRASSYEQIVPVL